MSIDLNFWRVQEGLELDSALVYQRACCGQEAVEGLEVLPVEAILEETGRAFPEWTALDPRNYEGPNGGSFQISAAAQTVRFDCYSMEPADLRRFAPVLAKFGCPLYDPQLGVRFDKLTAFLVDEAGAYTAAVERAFARLLPGLAVTSRTVTWEEYLALSQACGHIHYNAVIHRGKSQTKVTSFLRFGSGWTSRPCQCKTARLAEEGQAREVLEALLETSIERVVGDFRERTYYG